MHRSESLQQHLAAIVEGSSDAIITKSLDSIILSWNPAAQQLFGYAADEVIGQHITIIFPDDLKDEEADLIARLQRGEQIAHFETTRRRKDGTLVPISLTVSPVRDSAGRVIGASSIARDISLQKEAEKRQHLLLSEMRHRVGNAYALAGGLLAVTARQTHSVPDLVSAMRDRLNALASVHTLALSAPTDAAPESKRLESILALILEPFTGDAPVELDLPDLPVCSAAITPLTLVIYELATNAVKYGGLSECGGGLIIRAECQLERLKIRWTERFDGCSSLSQPHVEGFGTRMCHSTVESSLGGSFSRAFSSEGMTATLDLDLNIVAGPLAQSAE